MTDAIKPLDAFVLRRILGRFATGVAVVTSWKTPAVRCVSSMRLQGA